MRINLIDKIGSGITPKQYIEGMTRNKEALLGWHSRFEWAKEDHEFFSSYSGTKVWRCLILCTDWCPDVIWNAPVLFHVLEKARIDTEVLLMEQHQETMDLFLTDGGRAQPIAVFVDNDGFVLGLWGPRPAYIQTVMNEFRLRNPDRTASDYQHKVSVVREEIATLYNVGTEYQSVIVNELKTLFESMSKAVPTV